MYISRAWRAPAVAMSMLAFAVTGGAQQAYLNLDFETGIRGRPWAWSLDGTGYHRALDTTIKVSGEQSQMIQDVNATTLGSGLYQYFPLNDGKGHHITFSGYVRTDSVTQGSADLWLEVDGPGGMISHDIGPPDGVAGTKDWQAFTIDRDISPDAVEITLGFALNGNGTAWFDNFSVSVDGVPYPQGPPPYIGEPTAAQLAWIQKTANPFWTEDPTVPPDDLWPVAGMAGGAHIVGLGEGTHGTSEFFHMKHRLLEYLAANAGFTIFAIEANMPEAQLVNDYVLYGVGDPRKVLEGMYFWTWNTQEVLDMIEWMRAYNQSGQGQIQFTGFDMQFGSVAMQNARAFVASAEPGYLTTVDAAFAVAATVETNYQNGVSLPNSAVQAATGAVDAVRLHLIANRSAYLANGNTASAVDWAIQNALIVEQATYVVIGGGFYRDQCMASNIDWILQQNPGAKVVVWAHDMHVARTAGAMGSYLAANHGKDYVAFGQIFHQGQYNAVADAGLMANDATVSFPGTVEYVLHSTGMPKFILDMRQASPNDPGSSWLFGTTQYRYIGALKQDGFLYTNQLTTDYDVLIFFDQTSPSVLLPFN
jgi:erythromycin esterase